MFVTPASMVVALAFRDWVQFAEQKNENFNSFRKSKVLARFRRYLLQEQLG
jgi:hypothetical protein